MAKMLLSKKYHPSLTTSHRSSPFPFPLSALLGGVLAWFNKQGLHACLGTSTLLVNAFSCHNHSAYSCLLCLSFDHRLGRYVDRRLVATNSQRHELAHLPLVFSVLRILACRDPLGENGRRGENPDQTNAACGSPVEGCVGRIGTPEIQ